MQETKKEKPQGAGRNSFDLVDQGRLFRELRLKDGATFLDMACGRGDYAIAAAEIIGEQGLVHAVDLWEEGITRLRQEAQAKGIKHIRASVADVSLGIPVEDRSVDICLMATALHDLVLIKAADGALEEAARVLKPGGSLAVIEFKKIEGPPGPRIQIRLTSEDVESIVITHGFKRKSIIDLGPSTYLMTFSLQEAMK
jgi:ubiquinone/menaquinone biosynthesis C-methylase UbiE